MKKEELREIYRWLKMKYAELFDENEKLKQEVRGCEKIIAENKQLREEIKSMKLDYLNAIDKLHKTEKDLKKYKEGYEKKKRIQIVLEKINWKEFIKDIKIFKRKKDVKLTVKMIEDNLFQLTNYWYENPDERLTQVLVNNGIIPNAVEKAN